MAAEAMKTVGADTKKFIGREIDDAEAYLLEKHPEVAAAFGIKAPPAAPAIIKRTSGASKRAPGGAKYSREDMASRYPETRPAVMSFDKKKDDFYEGKKLSEEASAVQADLNRINEDMKEGYTPFFDPQQRFYVDPANYPLVGDTKTIRPSRAETLEKYSVKANDPEVLAKYQQAYDLGMQFPEARRWYAVGQLENAFTDALGPDLGRDMFKRRFAHSMAATTGGMAPASNLRLAHYMNYLDEAGLPTPLSAHELPYPIGGGKYGVMPNVAQHHAMIRQGGGLSYLNPKRFNFSGDFLGHLDKVTMDEQMMGPYGISSPPSNAYGVFEEPISAMAARLGVPGAEVQDVTWAGLKKEKDPSYEPQSMISVVNDLIERTSRLTGLSPEEVVEEGLVKAKRPVYAEGGAVSLSDLADRYGL